MFFSESSSSSSDSEIDIVPDTQTIKRPTLVKPYKPYWPGRANRQGNGPDMRCVINKRWRRDLNIVGDGKAYIAKLNSDMARNKATEALFKPVEQP